MQEARKFIYQQPLYKRSTGHALRLLDTHKLKDCRGNVCKDTVLNLFNIVVYNNERNWVK